MQKGFLYYFFVFLRQNKRKFKKIIFMKRFLSILVAFFALGAGFAQAQINANYLSVKEGQFYNENGVLIHDSLIQPLIGNEIYNETYTGAVKQFKTGKQLVIWGSVGAGVGLAISTGFLMALTKKYPNAKELPQNDPLTGGFLGGVALGSAGATALAVGIPFLCIGKNRLKWIAEDYNTKHASNVSLNLTGCSAGYGLGLAVNF